MVFIANVTYKLLQQLLRYLFCFRFWVIYYADAHIVDSNCRAERLLLYHNNYNTPNIQSICH